MDAITFATRQLEESFNLFNVCAGGIDEDQYNWKPAGTANVIARSHVHALSSIDFFINMLAAGGRSGWPEFAQANGLPANPLEIWKHEGRIPLAAVTEYGQQMQKRALENVAKLTDSDLDREIETNFFGRRPLSFLLHLASVHTVGHAGDMAAVKGMQGLKGLPF